MQTLPILLCAIAVTSAVPLAYGFGADLDLQVEEGPQSSAQEIPEGDRRAPTAPVD